MPKISVAIAAYNGEIFLPKQLDSILKQFKEQDELVISYDKSTDNTWALLQDYKSRFPQIKVLENKTPGIAGNFNNALSACTGDYIFICDQDDIWADTKREDVLARFEKENCDMVIHNGVHIDCADKVISDSFFNLYRIGNGKIKNILKPRYSGCCTAFTKEMAKKILPIPSDIDAYDHWVGTVGEFLGTISYEEKPLLYHRLHDNNVTPVSSRKLSTIFKATKTLLKHLFLRIKREKRG